MQMTVRDQKRGLIDDAYRDYLNGVNRGHPYPDYGRGQREHLFTPEEFDRMTPVQRIFYSPYSAEAFFLPIVDFDFTLERDRILFAIMYTQLALKVPNGPEYAIVRAYLDTHPFLLAYVNAL